jgi:acetylornithine/succinyldiaminopimelate/putrescine aminotransferase
VSAQDAEPAAGAGAGAGATAYPVDPADPVTAVQAHLVAAGDPAGLAVPAAPVVLGQVGARITAQGASRWLDAASGGFGAGHRAVTEAVADQLGRVALSSRILLSRPLAEAVTALAAFCPGALEVSYLCNSGAEALDAALKLAKGTHPRRRRVLSLAGEDYGTLAHGLSLTSGTSPIPGLALSADPVPATAVQTLHERVDRDVCAVVVAPAAPGRPLARLGPLWWRRLRDRCTATGALLVLDERLTAPGRLGLDLGAQALGIVPDALVLGESLGADAVPLGVMVTSRAVYDRVYAGHNPSLHGSTFGANPLSAAAVAAVLKAVRADGLAARQQDVAKAAEEAFGGLAGVVERGADGSLVWLRTAGPEAASALVRALAERQVLVRPPCGPERDVVALLPPLTTDPQDVKTLFDLVRVAVEESCPTSKAETR